MTEPLKQYSRRELLVAGGTSLLATTCRLRTHADQPNTSPTHQRLLAGRTMKQIRDNYKCELFDHVLPFWDRHGIDHEHGGFMCALDYDGTLRHTNKFHWYQGRGIWVYSYLFNHFGRKPQFQKVARKAKEFWLKHGRRQDGFWAELLSRTGKVLQPYRGDAYSMFTTAEGLQELAWAEDDDEARTMAFDMLKTAFRHVTRRQYHDLYAAEPGWRVQGIWIYALNCCTQMLRRWPEKSLAKIADTCVEAIIDKHYNPDIGLNNEFLNFDFSRPTSEANKCLMGHSIQALWHVMDEAQRRDDVNLYKTCAERVRRHLDVGWDHVYGGLCEWVNVNQFSHVWGPQQLGDQRIDLQMTGEYNYVKSFWALNEVMVATLHAYHQNRSDWAARYFTLAQDVADRKFSRRRHGQAGYLLASDRKMNYVPISNRQDNYHPLRRLMRNLRLLQQMTE